MADKDIEGKPIDPDKGGVVATKDLPVVSLATPDHEPEAIDDGTPKRPALKELTSVLYHGAASSVIITKEDFKAGAGVEAPEDLVWNEENGFTVPIARVNAAVVDHLIQDPSFTVV